MHPARGAILRNGKGTQDREELSTTVSRELASEVDRWPRPEGTAGGRRAKRKGDRFVGNSPAKPLPALNWERWDGAIVPTLRAVVSDHGKRSTTAFLSFSARGRAGFVQRIEEAGTVLTTMHADQACGLYDVECAKAWGAKMVAWVESGKLGTAPVPGLSDDLSEPVSQGHTTGDTERKQRSCSGRPNLVFPINNCKWFYELFAVIRRAFNFRTFSRSLDSPLLRFQVATIHDIYYMMLYISCWE
jgi:hypothetical protein